MRLAAWLKLTVVWFVSGRLEIYLIKQHDIQPIWRWMERGCRP